MPSRTPNTALQTPEHTSRETRNGKRSVAQSGSRYLLRRWRGTVGGRHGTAIGGAERRTRKRPDTVNAAPVSECILQAWQDQDICKMMFDTSHQRPSRFRVPRSDTLYPAT